jgi:small subunit ribosomal protein S21
MRDSDGQAAVILLLRARIRGGFHRGGNWRLPFAGSPQTGNTGSPVQVLVRDNNVDQALRALKKKMQREGIFREMKMRGHYEKPSEKRAREKAEAVRRARKLARKRAQREGLIPGSPRAAAAGAARAPR